MSVLKTIKEMTRKEHLQKLPLQKRLQAMENIRRTTSFIGFQKELSQEKANCYQLLSISFIYSETRQGHDYWMGIDYKYFGK